MNTLLLVVHVITCVLLIIVVLLQSGKDGGIGMVGGGSSQTIFGSSGGANFFTKFTSGAAVVFMLTSIGLTIVKSGNKKSVFDTMSAAPGASMPVSSAPAQPTAPQEAPKTK